MHESKVFGIGLSKTGTTSLNKALNLLGYQSAHYPIESLTYYERFPFVTQILNYIGYNIFNYPLGIHNYRIREPYIDFGEFEKYDAFTDIPISFCYRQLDKIYPGSKFVLTVREIEPWLMSCKKHVSRPYKLDRPKWWNDSEMGLWNEKSMNIVNRLSYDFYGAVVFNEKKFRETYSRHVEQVLKYFEGRSQDLLVIDLTKGEGWEKLCPFLGKAIPDGTVPKENVTA